MFNQSEEKSGRGSRKGKKKKHEGKKFNSCVYIYILKFIPPFFCLSPCGTKKEMEKERKKGKKKKKQRKFVYLFVTPHRLEGDDAAIMYLGVTVSASVLHNVKDQSPCQPESEK